MVASNSFAHQSMAEALAAIGRQLKEQREVQSLSIAEISGRTKIQQRLLQAIEAGDLEPLPEPVYIQQLVRRYAETLDLQGEEVARALPVSSLPQLTCVNNQGTGSALFRFVHLYLLYGALLVAASGGLLYLSSRSTQLERPSTTVGVR